MKRISNSVLCILLSMCLLLSIFEGVCYADSDSLTPTSAPVTSTQETGSAILSGGPSIGGEAAIVMEVNSGAILFAKNSTKSEEPVSLTKLLTCLMALENCDMTETVDCSYSAIHGIGSNVTRVGLEEDERLSVLDMIYASLVASADEATYALGEHIGGTMKNYLTKMNARATSLGCVNSNFVNAMGTGNSAQTSCAYDLGLIACAIAKYPAFYQIAGARWYELPSTNLNDSRIIAQTHAFIRQTKTYDYAKAGKSGGAGQNGRYTLCTYAEKDGMTLVAIVLGCPSSDASYDDTVTMLNYAFENYTVYDIKDAESQISDTYTGLFDVCPMFSQGGDDIVYTDDNASIVLPNGADISKVTKSVTYYDLAEYVHGENVLGALVYSFEGQPVGKTNIVFYNIEFPMSQEEFDAVWPKFLIPPSILVSQGGTGLIPSITPIGSDDGLPATPEPTLEAGATPTPAAKITKTPGVEEDTESQLVDEEYQKKTAAIEAKNKRAKIIAIVIFVVLYLAALAVIYIVLPMRARKARRQRARH